MTIKKTVLIVDDQEQYRSSFAALLKEHFDIVQASNYKDAKEKFLLQDPPFHVIITDLRLADSDEENEDGLALLQEINGRKAYTNTIVITGYPTIQSIKTSLKNLSAYDYIEKKPSDGGGFDVKSFVSIVQNAANDAESKRKKVSIFISYAKEDTEQAHSLYSLLSCKNLAPFLDEKNISPGSDWNLEIEKAIEKSDFFIACLSKNSVTKDGYFQKELKMGIEILERKPEDSIFLIPVRLDECIVPSRFQKIQWCDYFKEDGANDLLKAIFMGCSQQGIHINTTEFFTISIKIDDQGSMRVGKPYQVEIHLQDRKPENITSSSRFFNGGLRTEEIILELHVNAPKMNLSPASNLYWKIPPFGQPNPFILEITPQDVGGGEIVVNFQQDNLFLGQVRKKFSVLS